MSLINKNVKIEKKINGKIVFTGEVLIIDKVLTDKATYYQSAIMNNASMDIYVGLECGLDIVGFQYSDIVEIL